MKRPYFNGNRKPYYVGISLSKDKKKMYVQMTTNRDCLSCELYDFFDNWYITKKETKRCKHDLLKILQRDRPILYANVKTITFE